MKIDFRRCCTATILMAMALSVPLSAKACEFNFDKKEYVGTPVEQARCLMQTFPGEKNRRSEGGVARTTLGEPLQSLVGRPFTLDKKKIAEALEKAGVVNLATSLNAPLSKTSDGISARYFVIHDTSTPYPYKPFPAPDSPAMRALGGKWNDGTWRAHSWVNRQGAARLTVDYSKTLPNPAIRFERDHKALKGLFLHTEVTQPRKLLNPKNSGSDAIIPVPAFLPAQYDTLALLYVAASARAGNWLVPAFHISLDKGISGGHDDPQHFDLEQFSAALQKWTSQFAEGKK